MLSDLMRDQQQRLIRQMKARPERIDPTTISVLALLDTLDILGSIRNPSRDEN